MMLREMTARDVILELDEVTPGTYAIGAAGRIVGLVDTDNKIVPVAVRDRLGNWLSFPCVKDWRKITV